MTEKMSSEILIKEQEYKNLPIKKDRTHKRMQIRFNKENIVFLRNGEEVNIDQYTQEQNIDTTIYDVLKKYKGDMTMTKAELNKLSNRIVEDVSMIKDLNDLYAEKKRAEQVWSNLPLEIRKEFDNNPAKFMKNGINWANQKIKEYEALTKAPTQTAQTTTTGEVTNEQK